MTASARKKTATRQGADKRLKVATKDGAQALTSSQIAGRKRGAKRTNSFQSKVLAAKLAIEKEIAANGGVYPGGEVTLALLARLAGVNPRSFYTNAQRTFGEECDTWRKALVPTPSGDKEQQSAKKTLQERYDDLKKENKGLVESSRFSELGMQQAEAELEAALEELAAVKSELESFRQVVAALGDSKVVPLKGRGQSAGGKPPRKPQP